MQLTSTGTPAPDVDALCLVTCRASRKWSIRFPALTPWPCEEVIPRGLGVERVSPRPASHSGTVQSRACPGNTFQTHPGDHTSPKRKRGLGLPSLALRARMPGVSPGVEPGRNSTMRRLDLSPPPLGYGPERSALPVLFNGSSRMESKPRSSMVVCSKHREQTFPDFLPTGLCLSPAVLPAAAWRPRAGGLRPASGRPG